MTQPDPQNPVSIPASSASAVDDRPHRAPDDTEEVYYQGSPLLRGKLGKLFGCVLLGCIIFAIPIALAVEHHAPPIGVWLGAILVGLIIIMIPVIAARRIRFRISNYRIDSESGLISTNIYTLELWHVEDIRFHQSMLDRLMGVGTITVISRDALKPELIMHGIPNARPLFQTLEQRIIAVKRQPGVMKVDSGN
jgi:hypothetical protein